MEYEHQQVVVVGAGPVGFLIALGLAQKGIKVAILDAEGEINQSPRAAVYFPTTLAVLDQLGLLEDAEAIGLQSTVFAMRFPDTGEVIEADLIDTLEPDAQYDHNLHFGQHILADLVLRHLGKHPNATMLWNHRVSGLDQDADRVTLTVETPEGTCRITSDWVVGADGARSTVRGLLDLPFEGHTWPDRFVATNIEFDFEKYGYAMANMIIDPQDWAVVGRLGRENLWRLTYGEDASLDEATVLDRIPEHMARILPGDGAYRLVGASPYRVHERCASSFRSGRALLAGDAAHACNPCGGLGLTTGVLDSEALIAVLSAVIVGTASEEVLDFYAAERRRVFKEVTSPMASYFKRQLSEPDPEQRRVDRAAFLEGLKTPAESRTASTLGHMIRGTPMPV